MYSHASLCKNTTLYTIEDVVCRVQTNFSKSASFHTNSHSGIKVCTDVLSLLQQLHRCGGHVLQQSRVMYALTSCLCSTA